MAFYALRIICWKCGAASLLGGSAEHDLSRWRDATVECSHCGADSSAADALPVALRARPRRGEAVEELVRDPSGA